MQVIKRVLLQLNQKYNEKRRQNPKKIASVYQQLVKWLRCSTTNSKVAGSNPATSKKFQMENKFKNIRNSSISKKKTSKSFN